MAYIGKTPVIGNVQKCDSISVVNGQAAYTLQVGGVNVSPQSENHMLVSLNGILQAPVDSFTVSGSTLTFASNLVTGDVIDFVMILGNVLDLGVPSDNTVSLAKLTATGTKDATTFLRGDNTFAVPAGGENTPLFKVRLATNQNITTGTRTVIAFDSVSFDTGSNWDNTNKRYIPDEAGYYLFFSQVRLADSADFSDFGLRIRKNANTTTDSVESNVSSFHFESNYGHVIFYMNGTTDYADVTAYHNKGSDSTISAPYYTWFQGFKLIGS